MQNGNVRDLLGNFISNANNFLAMMNIAIYW